ncbi:hypothetical protein Nepgr_009987 [Nepenthes gracilis]|uniref:cytokinin dehydrogenase n=1 Tax=Nepenthes gracilis TaxID=150966 RepID=A0AAD3SCF3_NEPGR|nr:hypothetical protein Nepgr_009987 [Nepenthes gracilis]
MAVLQVFMVLILNSISHEINRCSYFHHATPTFSNSRTFIMESSLKSLNLDGQFNFKDIHHAAGDFGNRYHFLPVAILYPKTVSDISSTIKHVFNMGPASELTIAARGHGHSLQGQAQAHRGIVINMESLRGKKMHVHTGELPYIDVSGGELWINILHETLKYGFAPKSWTDYLHLTVGGTLSHAGISGQAFRHGPQIDNVYELEVVTGKGEVFVCSEKQNADLFYGVLGGLGQFGIITRAKISLEPAPRKAKWIRVLYSDFYSFTKDQEHLIALEDTVDYIEGFVIINKTGFINNWRSSFNPRDPHQASQFISDGRTLYCLEMAKYFDLEDTDAMNKMDNLLSKLDCIQQTYFLSEVSYVDFLDRVHLSEKKLREKGLWDVPHPWLNLLVPRRSINDFAEEVFGKILTDNNNGPILIYPVNQLRWNNKTSLITPKEDVFYLILDFCGRTHLGVKQYLPHYGTREGWRAHFGTKWEDFARRKSTYDPLAILAPGQRIFQKAVPFHDTAHHMIQHSQDVWK